MTSVAVERERDKGGRFMITPQLSANRIDGQLCLSAKEAAECAGVSKECIKHMVRTGKLPSLREAKRIWIPLDAFNKWATETRWSGRTQPAALRKGTALAWLAGFFEGEGCIFISSGPNVRWNKEAVYSLHISVSNTLPELISIFERTFGGSVRTKKEREGWKTATQWSIGSNKAATTLRLLLPYFKSASKRKQAQVAIEFQEHINYWRSLNGRGERVPDKEWKFREECALRLKELKREVY